MIEYVMYFIKDDGSIPLVGDNDSGRIFNLSELDRNNRKYYLSIGTIIFNRSDFKYVASKFHEEAFWLRGDRWL